MERDEFHDGPEKDAVAVDEAVESKPFQRRERPWSEDYFGTTSTLEAVMRSDQSWKWRRQTTLRQQNVPVTFDCIRIAITLMQVMAVTY